jgi:hypothetical protein
MIDSLEIASPVASSVPHRYDLPMLNAKLLVSTGAVLRGDVDRSRNAELIVFVENTCDSEAACVFLEDDRHFWVEVLVDWCISECLLALLNCELCRLGPFPFACINPS